MTRIPDHLIERIKVEVPVKTLAERAGIALKVHGENLVGLCVFHPDHNTPNLVITPAKNVFHCFACGAAGSPIDWVMGIERVSFRVAAAMLLSEFFPRDARLDPAKHPAAKEEVSGGAPPVASTSAPSRVTRPRAFHPPGEPSSGRTVAGGLVSRAPRTEAFCRVVDEMGNELAQQRRAHEYLESRGLVTRALWRVLKLGYCSGAIAELAGTEETSELRRILQAIGILTGDGEPRMKGRIVCPLLAFNQLPVGLYGRVIDDEQRPHHMYLPGPRKGLINWSAARRSKEILFTEAPFDTLSLCEAGVFNSVPLYGTNGLTEEHKEMVRRCGVTSVVVALDADEAGRKAAPGVVAAFAAMGVSARSIEWPEKDPNEVLVKHGPKKTREIVEKLLAPAKPRDLPAAGDSSSSSESVVSEALLSLVADVVPEVGDASLASVPAENEATKEGSSAVTTSSPASSSSSSIPREKLLAEVLDLASDGRLWSVTWTGVPSPAHLRATVRVRIAAPRDVPPFVYIDSVDLLAAKARESFAKKAASSVAPVDRAAAASINAPPQGNDAEVTLALQRALDADLIRITAIGEERRTALETKDAISISMTDLDRKKALRFLRSSDLLEQTADHIELVGYVGERPNKKLGYLVGISRKLDVPLSMVILSPSGSGKSGLADALEAMTPEEDFVSLSSITAQALYYMPQDKLRRKFILIEERAGSLEADYSIRALQSKKKLTRAVPIKDPSTGKIETKIFEILGPAAFLETTTESRINVENSTRCFEIHLDESQEQTERIQRAQRHAKTFEGLRERERREEALKLHHDAQRLLRTISVVIPFADEIEFPTAWLRTRRDNLRFLHLIEVLAFLRQYQRPIVDKRTVSPLGKRLEELSEEDLKDAVVIATLDDYKAAYELAGGLLGDTLQDLKRPEREFLEALRNLAEKRLRQHEGEDFARREAREWSGLPQHRVRQLFDALLELEYIEPVRSSRGAGVRYRLTSAARTEPSIPGLLKPEELKKKLDALADERRRKQRKSPGREALSA